MLEATLKADHIPDWIIIIYIVCLVLLVLAKTQNPYLFKYFSRLYITDIYIKANALSKKDKIFHTTCTVFHMLLFPLSVQICLYKLGYINELAFFQYLIFIGWSIAYLVAQRILSLVVGLFFSISKITTQIVFEKETYANYLSLVSCFPLIVLIYNTNYSKLYAYIFLILFILFVLLITLTIINHFRKQFNTAPHYFILYICGFEIAPLILMCSLIFYGQ